jgi:hypothetical protein
MATIDGNNHPAAEAGPGTERRTETSMDLRPTLFIGVGGTGMEVLLRLRRRILNALWGPPGARVRVESLADFPVAQFMHFDLDTNADIESGRAQADDLQYELVRFNDDEKVVETFDVEKYNRDEDALEKYPHVKEWLPLTPRKLRELGIDPSHGAGQVRGLARLYFFDKYAKTRDKVRHKLKDLKAGLSHERQLARLGLKMESSKFRVVVIASVAGGTGAGAFLDMGWLARWLARAEVGAADVELLLLLPTGYAGANKDRTEANGYAALMELESAMRGNRAQIGRWDPYEQAELPREPYNDVYLVDTGNLARQHTKHVSDVHFMVADALFEDFLSGDFARRKRSVAVNQAQHKNQLFDAPVPRNRFGDMRLSYAMRYSAFGQAVLDTRQAARREHHAHRWAAGMLQAFFGVGAADVGALRATDRQRDEFMEKHLALRPVPFAAFPTFSDPDVKLQRATGEFKEYFVVEELLQDRQGLLIPGVEQRVNQRMDEIRSGFDRKEWPAQVRDALRELERDAVRDQDSVADTTEDRVARRRRELLQRMQAAVRDQLYAYLDNKEFGGLEYVLSLVEQVKDRLEAPGLGLIAALRTNAERYREIKEAVRGREFERLVGNLEQTQGRFFGGSERQAVAVMDHLRTELANAIRFHLRAKAADEAALLMAELSAWLGRKGGVDAQGRAVWSGLMGELQAGREAVVEMLGQLRHSDTILQRDLGQEYATLIALEAREREVRLPAAAQLRAWADEAFKDLGGSRVLFPLLQDPAQRRELLTKVQRMAERQLVASGLADAEGGAAGDPLTEALAAMDPARRQALLRRLLACAMPWVDANLGGDFTVRADQYKCFLGVAGAQAFEREYRAELDACMPTVAGITPAQLHIVETGQPGRAVCYCELSGLPMTVLRGLEGWRASYRKESERIPTHTHIDSTQFSHPIAPSTEEIGRLAEDFKQFLLAVMLGVLTRSPQRFVPPGQYQFAVARGDQRRIGNERAIRQNGLPPAYREAIVTRVQEQLAEADAGVLAALAALCEYTESAVYTPKLVADATGAEQVRKGFASAIAAEARQQLRDSARRKGLTERELDDATRSLLAQLPAWTLPVGDSDADAFEWEVREPDAGGEPRLKRVLRPEMLQGGALRALLQGTAGMAASAAGAGPGATQAQPAALGAMPPPLGAMPPPLPGAAPPLLVEHQYHLGVNGQTYGPFVAAQIAHMLQARQIAAVGTKVWRAGLPGWVELTQLAELAALLPLGGGTQAPSVPPPLN